MRSIAPIFILTLLWSSFVWADPCVPRTVRMELAAEEAGLHYNSHPGGPGISRSGTSPHFIYRDAENVQIEDVDTLHRIESLGIPPSYREVWISPDPESHIQATAVDDRGRTQYRYHPKWIEHQSLTKFERMKRFGEALPAMRARIEHDMGAPELPGLQALIVKLLEKTYIRVGNDEYAAENSTFGLTTLLKSQVRVQGSSVQFDFIGKAHVHHDISVDDPALASIIKELQKLPGENLFQYRDGTGAIHPIDSTDVNHYIHAISGQDFTAKDFRTWGGSTSAALSLIQAGPPSTEAAAHAATMGAVAFASGRLGNTPAVCRANYIHPVILSAYEKNGGSAFFNAVDAAKQAIVQSQLSLEEQTVLELLK